MWHTEGEPVRLQQDVFQVIRTKFCHGCLMASGVALSQEDPEQAEEVIEEVVVVGIKGALQSALDTKRDSDVIMDGISANDIGNFPDLNLAESLQRVTGVQISVEGDEGQRRQGRIAIRGLPTNYSVTTYNGQFLGTPRPDFGFSFGNIESSVVSAVNVLKTTTARMDAGGLAGTVDIQSKRALDVQEPYVRLGLQTTYETNLEDYAPGYSLAFGTKFADDKWGVVGSISTAEQHFRTDVVRINSYNSDDTDGDGLDDFYVPSQVRLISRDSEGDRLSATLGLEFQATDKLKLGVDALYVEDPIVHNFAMMRAYKAEEYVPLDSVTNSTFGETVTRVNFLNPEIRSQQRIIDEENKTEALTFNAEWTNDDWTVKGAIHHTKGTQLAIGSITRRRLDDDPGNGINILVDTGPEMSITSSSKSLLVRCLTPIPIRTLLHAPVMLIRADVLVGIAVSVSGLLPQLRGMNTIPAMKKQPISWM